MVMVMVICFCLCFIFSWMCVCVGKANKQQRKRLIETFCNTVMWTKWRPRKPLVRWSRNFLKHSRCPTTAFAPSIHFLLMHLVLQVLVLLTAFASQGFLLYEEKYACMLWGYSLQQKDTWKIRSIDMSNDFLHVPVFLLWQTTNYVQWGIWQSQGGVDVGGQQCCDA